MKVALVATHEERYFSTLLRSLKKRNIDYDVLGWGEKWDGFMMKYRLMVKWLKKRNPSEIIVFLDSFDSVVIGNPQITEKAFRNSGYNIIFSSPSKAENHIIGKYIRMKMFGTPIATFEQHKNAGMYIAYAGPLLEFLQELLSVCTTNDDERCLNTNVHLQKKYKVGVDFDDLLFINGPNSFEQTKPSKSVFAISQPGGFTIHESWHDIIGVKVDPCVNCMRDRWYRGLFEYYQFFIPEIIFICVALIFFFSN